MFQLGGNAPEGGWRRRQPWSRWRRRRHFQAADAAASASPEGKDDDDDEEEEEEALRRLRRGAAEARMTADCALLLLAERSPPRSVSRALLLRLRPGVGRDSLLLQQTTDRLISRALRSVVSASGHSPAAVRALRLIFDTSTSIISPRPTSVSAAPAPAPAPSSTPAPAPPPAPAPAPSTSSSDPRRSHEQLLTARGARVLARVSRFSRRGGVQHAVLHRWSIAEECFIPGGGGGGGDAVFAMNVQSIPWVYYYHYPAAAAVAGKPSSGSPADIEAAIARYALGLR